MHTCSMQSYNYKHCASAVLEWTKWSTSIAFGQCFESIWLGQQVHIPFEQLMPCFGLLIFQLLLRYTSRSQEGWPVTCDKYNGHVHLVYHVENVFQIFRSQIDYSTLYKIVFCYPNPRAKIHIKIYIEPENRNSVPNVPIFQGFAFARQRTVIPIFHPRVLPDCLGYA